MKKTITMLDATAPPPELRELNRWVLWQLKDGRKVPCDASGANIDLTDSNNWQTYDNATAAYTDELGKFAGLGFVLGNGICGIDLDDCVAEDKLAPWAQQIVDECDSYYETSPSGSGVKIFCKGTIPKSWQRKQSDGGAIEVYGKDRYFTVTGEGDCKPLRQIPERLTVAPTNGKTPSRGGEPPGYDRCLEKVMSLPKSISGKRGHDALFHAACETVRHGILGEPGLEILRQFNAKRANPQWSEDDLSRKFAEAQKQCMEENQVGIDARCDDFEILKNPGGGAKKEVESVCFTEIDPKQISWLWEGRIPAGRITVLCGMPGAGKGFATCDMAARISRGEDWPDGEPCAQGMVLFITAEDDPFDVIRPRLDAAGADISQIRLLRTTKYTSSKGEVTKAPFKLADVDALEAHLKTLPDCRLVVIDPIGSFLGGGVDSHRDNEVRDVLAPVAVLDEEYGCAVLMIAHARKGHSEWADDTVMGSRAFTGIARAVWHLMEDPNDRQRRMLLPGKCNLARQPDGLAFTIEGDPPAVRWDEEPVSWNANDAMIARSSREKTRGTGAALDEAHAFLMEMLGNGPQPSNKVMAEATTVRGIAEATLKRARKRLGVIAYQKDGPTDWWMEIPGCGESDETETHDTESEDQ